MDSQTLTMSKQIQRFKFNTGVHISSGAPLYDDQFWDGNGVKCIPFDCEDVPEGARFAFAASVSDLGHEGMIVREILNSSILSRFAYFHPPVSKTPQI